MKTFTKKKAGKLWNSLFSPLCPKCKGTKTREELRDMPVVANMKEMLRRMTDRNLGKPVSPVRTWVCLDCQTVYDEKGRMITYEKK